jgi:hypothetical protein
MATWHQLRRPVKLWHETQWTVVIDPPNALRSLVTFDTEAKAIAYAKKVEHSYVLPPAKKVQ